MSGSFTFQTNEFENHTNGNYDSTNESNQFVKGIKTEIKDEPLESQSDGISDAASERLEDNHSITSYCGEESSEKVFPIEEVLITPKVEYEESSSELCSSINSNEDEQTLNNSKTLIDDSTDESSEVKKTEATNIEEDMQSETSIKENFNEPEISMRVPPIVIFFKEEGDSKCKFTLKKSPQRTLDSSSSQSERNKKMDKTVAKSVINKVSKKKQKVVDQLQEDEVVNVTVCPEIYPLVESEDTSDPGLSSAASSCEELKNESEGDKRSTFSQPKISASLKSFPCLLCIKSFSTRANLINHIRVHTGEKPFSCHICPKSFSQKSALSMHLAIHKGEKRYSCHICSKKFSRNYHLSDHLRTHTGEKPFTCDICSKMFGRKSTLLRHQSVHISN